MRLLELVRDHEGTSDTRVEAVKKGVKMFGQLLFGTKDDGTREEPAISPDDCSLKEMLWACVPDSHGVIDERVRESVGYQDFIEATTKLVSKKAITEYEEGLGEALSIVSQTTSTKLEEKIIQFPNKGSLRRKFTGRPYAGGGERTEHYVEDKRLHWGEIIEVDADAVRFDQTDRILAWAGSLTKTAGAHLAKLVTYTLEDKDRAAIYEEADPGRYIVDGTKRDIFSDDHSAWFGYANDNIGTANFTGNGLARLKEAWEMLSAMVNREGEPILNAATELTIIASKEDFIEAVELITSKVKIGASNATPNVIQNISKLNAIFLPHLDLGVVYIGAPKRQLRLSWIEKFQVQRQETGSDKMFDLDLVARFKVFYFANCQATDYLHLIKFAAA